MFVSVPLNKKPIASNGAKEQSVADDVTKSDSFKVHSSFY